MSTGQNESWLAPPSFIQLHALVKDVNALDLYNIHPCQLLHDLFDLKMDPGLRAVIVAITVTSFAGVVLVLRCISRFLIVRKNGADDVFAIMAHVSSVMVTCLICKQYPLGLGTDIDKVSLQDQIDLSRLGWASIIAYSLSMTFVKLSALLQYLRFLNSGALRTICYVLIVLCCSVGTCGLFVGIFRCRPISFAWDTQIEGGTCINLAAFAFFVTALVIITNVIIIALPMIAFKDLTMPKAQKRALIAVFALGGFDFIASVMRLYSVWAGQISPNKTNHDADIALWSCVEVNVGIICISLPPIKALVVSIFPPTLLSPSWKRSQQSSEAESGILQLQPTGSVRANSAAPVHERDPWAIP